MLQGARYKVHDVLDQDKEVYDPSVAAIWDSAEKFDPKTERLFRYLQVPQWFSLSRAGRPIPGDLLFGSPRSGPACIPGVGFSILGGESGKVQEKFRGGGSRALLGLSVLAGRPGPQPARVGWHTTQRIGLSVFPSTSLPNHRGGAAGSHDFI